MNILFVTRGFPNEQDIMDGNYEAVQAKALAANNCNVSVIVIREKTIGHLFQSVAISHRVVDGVDVYEGIYIALKTRFIRRINKYLRKIAYDKAFKKCVHEKGMPDVVHAHLLYIAFYSFFLKRKYSLPFVITEHWSKVFRDTMPNWIKQITNTYYYADQVICVSQSLADSLKKKYHVDSIVINNMLNDIFFKSDEIERHDDEFRFIACGAFREDKLKGFDILVDAFALAHFPEKVHLYIVGDGVERPFIEEMILKYNLSSQIHLLGTKTPEEVSKLYDSSDCFVLSSRLETFAIVVIEAMAKGLPVIATKCGGPESFLLPEHGLLVEKEDVDALSIALKYMKDHYRDYDPIRIREYCYNHFSQDVIANQIIDVYKRVIYGK